MKTKKVNGQGTLTGWLAYLRPWSFYRRERELYKQLAAGTALNSSTLLEIDFGHFPPKGLQITERNENPVNIRSIYQDHFRTPLNKLTGSLFMGGYVHTKKTTIAQMEDYAASIDISAAKKEKPETADSASEYDRSLYLNNFLYSPVGQAGYLSALWSMPVIIKAFSTDPALSALSIFFVVPFLSSLRLSPLTHLTNAVKEFAIQTVGHEHLHLLQRQDDDETKTGFHCFDNNFYKRDEREVRESKLRMFLTTIDDTASYNSIHYLRSDYETQARLHVLTARNYSRWGRLPTTKHELWAALIDAGMNAPRRIHKALKEGPVEGKPEDFLKPGLTATFGRAARRSLNTDVADLNVGTRSLHQTFRKERHWEETLPYLYGHMLELYGDRNGRLYMGFTGALTKGGTAVPVDADKRTALFNTLSHDDVLTVKTEELCRNIHIHDKDVETIAPDLKDLFNKMPESLQPKAFDTAHAEKYIAEKRTDIHPS